MSDTSATSNAGAIAEGVWNFLKTHPVVLAVLFFVIGFIIG